jgi:hypothetical protein
MSFGKSVSVRKSREANRTMANDDDLWTKIASGKVKKGFSYLMSFKTMLRLYNFNKKKFNKII